MTEQEAFDIGYRCVLPHRGPKNPVQRWLEENVSEGVVGVPVHPLTKEMLYEAFERLPEHLHESLAKGFMTGMRELADAARRGEAS